VASTIGIKIANGEFYSIVEENSQVKKRLVLTTVHDNQQSAQIDLYRSSTGTMADAFYIGSLVLENIKPKSKGEPSVELVISSASNGNISANAVDMDASGGRQTLNVSLKSMEDNLGADIPDFEFDNNENAPKGLYEDTDESRDEKKKKKFPWLLVALSGLVLIAVGLLVWLFFFRGSNPITSLIKPAASVSRSQPSETTPQAQSVSKPETTQPAEPSAPATQSASQPEAAQPAEPSTPAAQSTPQPEAAQPAQSVAAPAVQPVAAPAAQSTPQPEAVQPAQSVAAPAAQPVQPVAAQAVQVPPPVIQSPAQAPATVASANRERPPAPVASYNVPAVIPKEGAPYKIRYGDTLWAIADAFYRNPWLYTRIARFNNIRNPDLIISGTTIIVPPKN